MDCVDPLLQKFDEIDKIVTGAEKCVHQLDPGLTYEHTTWRALRNRKIKSSFIGGMAGETGSHENSA